MMTNIVGCSTSEPFVFAAHGAHTPTSAQSVSEDIPNVPAPSRHSDVITHTIRIHTPLRPQVFARFLNSHPNQAFVSNLIYSLTYGFNIGYTGPRLTLTAPNLPSAYQQPHIVDEALNKEVAEHRMAGPFLTPPYPNLRCSGVATN